MDQHEHEVARGERFEFGRNWQRFLARIDEARIAGAERSLQQLLDRETLVGQTFLDIGSGSGLFSLAARRLGARVHSFDYDPQSVACTRTLKQRYAPSDDQWTIDEASVLDQDYLHQLPQFDIVYSWGVLHQTGGMWQALDLVAERVAPGGRLAIALYNDQGGKSRRWRTIKRWYNRSPRWLQWLMCAVIGAGWEIRDALVRLVRFQNPLPFGDWRKRTEGRGMSIWHDIVDWVGGYPFEVARPHEVFTFYFRRGFPLVYMTTVGMGHGCNEYVFARPAESPATAAAPPRDDA
jgi:2-polyprenyl-3-methyl-5-hydroxy-6-metoxy-1,4-benzoquinol methylase